ncbi:MAG: hypothetical protein LUQ24_08890 [Methanobacterium sp.]|nr:hypothetical protein [Methanobacterium sp.]
MGYLICAKCGGYYQLQPGESPEDFLECQCGGKLEYTDKINDIKEDNGKLPSLASVATHTRDPKEKEKSFFNSPKTLIITVIAVAAILFKLGVFNFLLIFIGHSNSYTYLMLLIFVTVSSILVRRILRT